MYSHWQEHLFPYHYSEELELLYKASQSYHWERLEKELAPKFKKAAEEFHHNTSTLTGIDPPMLKEIDPLIAKE